MLISMEVRADYGTAQKSVFVSMYHYVNIFSVSFQ